MRIIDPAECTGVLSGWPGHMQRAFELARTVLSCAPNPRVGCVIVRDSRRVAEGFHAGAGYDHAEIAALASDPEGGSGATVFVTLEPCSHQGRTGPCAEALINAGVKQVVIASLDPNPRVSGIPRLEAAGIEVFQLADFAGAAQALNAGYARRMRTSRPYVRCKLAMSLDGRTALANGASQWITDPEARADAQLLRAGSCAIVTGIDSVITDDPSLNVRPEALSGTARELAENRLAEAGQPLRVILDSALRTPSAARILTLDGAVKIFSLRGKHTAGAYSENVEVITAPARAQRVGLEFVLNCLASRFECNEILVEAGPILGGAFVTAGLVDELVIYMGARLLGSDAKPLLEFPGPDSLAQSIALEIDEVRAIGNGVRLIARPAAE